MNKIILQQLKKRKTFSLLSDGKSMLPLLHPKDLVNYNKVNFSKIKISDLLLVFKKNLSFTHRVIYKTDKFLVTKGDNNLESDGKIYPRQIIGKVTSVKRKNRIIDPEMIYLIQSSLYFKEIVKIIDAFKKNKINYVFLKGIPIHLYYEKTHPRRIYQDADVLIEKPHYKMVAEILTKFGYRFADLPLSSTQKKLRDKIVEISFYKLVNGFPVVFDIHLEPAFMMTQIGSLNALYPQYLIDRFTQELLKTKREKKINGETFLILNINYLILYLALHFFHHNYSGTFRLELLDKIIRKKQLTVDSWQPIIKIINKYQLSNFVSPVFYLLKKYYRTPIPHFIYGSIATDSYKNLNIFDDESRLSSGIIRFKNILHFSPKPFIIKLLVFLNPQVIYLILFTIKFKVKNLLQNSSRPSTLNL